MNSPLTWLIKNRLVALILAGLVAAFGIVFTPFELNTPLPSDPIAVDAIPDIGENQQIVFTKWPGRSPKDIDDQITYPLTTALLGVPGVKTIRASSMFGFSSIYVIFEDDVEFYWSRTRVLEKLNALPQGTLPDGIVPSLGPDATALGQVFWYTLEARDPEGTPVHGWSLHELRTIQDWNVKSLLQAAPGVSEVASIGGYQMEYQVDIRPEALVGYKISLSQVANSIRQANVDIGARTIEIAGAEYVVRGVGTLESEDDLRDIVVAFRNDRAIRLSDLAHINVGPALRRGALDYGGAEAVGGIVVSRFGENPVKVISEVKKQIAAIAPSLPERTLEDGTRAKVTIVPIYDRSELIGETVETLSDALIQQILITILVVLFLLGHLRSALAITLTLPLAVLIAFIAMKLFGVTANIMSLAGIAIAIGAMVDIGIVMVENIVQRLQEDDTSQEPENRIEVVALATKEVAPAIVTSVATTVLSFLPVFALTASEGKLFTPLALTKTFAMIGAVGVAFLLLPPLTYLLMRSRIGLAEKITALGPKFAVGLMPKILAFVMVFLITNVWMPLGFGTSYWVNLLFVAFFTIGILGGFWVFERLYPRLLSLALQHKAVFSVMPVLIVAFGLLTWQGAPKVFAWVPVSIKTTPVVSKFLHGFPGLGAEFMPPFDEGDFLYMPTTMPHASIGTALEQLKRIDARIAMIPEVEDVLGKLGRADTPLDPAPISMFETLITYKSEWKMEDGERVRQWRDHIRTPDDIWNEILDAADYPGVTSAPKLMPINTRIVMLQTGMRAPLGLKVWGDSLESVERAALALEGALKQIPSIRKETVFAERVVGKPYLEIEVDRKAIARFGLSVRTVQETVQVSVGGAKLTETIEGRERFAVSLRYERDARQSVDSLRDISIATPNGESIPLSQVAQIQYVRGPQVIKSENTRLLSYVTFDKTSDLSDVQAVDAANAFLKAEIAAGRLKLPPGTSFDFAGTYESQIRSAKTLSYLVPLAVILIFLLLYIQFGETKRALMIFSGVAVAMAGGFVLLWFYNQPWFLNFSIAGHDMRTVFHVGPTNLSVAIWVGFIALIGIATDDGVVMATYLKAKFKKSHTTIEEVRESVLEAGRRRIRPCLMTTATTLLALLPVITATGRGSDVMAPMALPIFGGMIVELVTLFVVPVLWSAAEEWTVEVPVIDTEAI